MWRSKNSEKIMQDTNSYLRHELDNENFSSMLLKKTTERKQEEQMKNGTVYLEKYPEIRMRMAD